MFSQTAAQEQPETSAIFEEIRREAEAIGSVRSLLIQQNGQHILEQYYHGMQPGRKMNTKSAS
ncbi:MAG: hypothetical protein JXR26_00210, partial [Balneolaceae bacterium]|nr:hypothetical protein [Balneolaceae bacterium]